MSEAKQAMDAKADKLTNSQLKKLDPLPRLPAAIRALFHQRTTLADLRRAQQIVEWIEEDRASGRIMIFRNPIGQTLGK